MERTIKNAVITAVQRSDLRAIQKLRVRFALALRPDAMAAVEEYVVAVLIDRDSVRFASLENEDLSTVLFSEVDWQYIIELIIEYLPMILQLLLLFI